MAGCSFLLGRLVATVPRFAFYPLPGLLQYGRSMRWLMDLQIKDQEHVQSLMIFKSQHPLWLVMRLAFWYETPRSFTRMALRATFYTSPSFYKAPFRPIELLCSSRETGGVPTMLHALGKMGGPVSDISDCTSKIARIGSKMPD